MATRKKYKEFIESAIKMSDEELQESIDALKEKLSIKYGLEGLVRKVEFWTHRYEFSFQFWGAGQNNVYINKDDVEIASFGGDFSISDIMRRTIEWCEKANPRIKYPTEIYKR